MIVDVIASIARVEVLVPWILGMFLGVFVGAIPGLTATMSTAILVPITYYLSPMGGLAMILGCACVSIFAGDIPATYLRVPGTPSSGAAVLDGYELTKRGEASRALSLDLTCSTIGGLIGFTLLVAGATGLAAIALKFSFYEFLWVAVFGLATCVIISKGTAVKGGIAVALGLFFSCVGVDIVTGYPRFTFGNVHLLGGVGFIPAMIGLFGVPVVLRNIMTPKHLELPSVEDKKHYTIVSVLPIVNKFKGLILRSSLMGTFIGSLPGAGADIAAWVAYGMAKRNSKEPEKFGTGCDEGVIAPTSANNAGIAGAWIPALALGIPGDSITAIILGASMIYGLRPGPLMFVGASGELVRGLFAIGLITQILMVPVGFLAIKAFGQVFKLPNSVIMPMILVFCIVGSYALNFSMFDVGLMFFFGLLGFYMERNSIPLPPLVLAIILGPLIERNLRLGLMQTGGDLLPFFTRPISIIVIVGIILFLTWGRIAALVCRLRGTGGSAT
jgi:putative tricarboxylic transport membrane protein